MRRQVPIAHRLYNHLFPDPGPNDPQTFAVHLGRNLVPEVRIEVATFYGDLKSDEARYPGLDYSFGPHRMRLGRFPHHRDLFAAFDALGLTNCEILDFCCWEGTKWARERYEKDEGIKVIDTTGDEIKKWVDPRDRDASAEQHRRQSSITRKTDISVIVEEAESVTDQHHDEHMHDGESDAESEASLQDHTPEPIIDQPISHLRMTPRHPIAITSSRLAQHRRLVATARQHNMSIRAAAEYSGISSSEVEELFKELMELNSQLTRERRAQGQRLLSTSASSAGPAAASPASAAATASAVPATATASS